MSAATLTIGVGILLLATVIGGFFLLQRQIRELLAKKESDQSLFMLNQTMVGMQQRMDVTNQAINQRLDKAAMVMQGLMKEAGTMNEIGRSIKEFQEFLNSPKLRGNIGEHVLADALGQVFAKDQYELQFRFREGQTVDALIRSANGFIPVDSKFPLEDYRKMMAAEDAAVRATHLRDFERAVRKHIDDIAKKYILPSEGTVDFAVMYVPSESVYYEIVLQSDSIMEHARGRRIILVSPNTFFHFLRVILMGLERTQLAEESKRVWELLRGIQQDTGKFSESLALVAKHLTNAKNAMDGAAAEYGRLATRIDQVKLLK